MARVLVTGASGFLGSALVREWAARGHDVHALVRPSSALDRIESVLGLIHLHRTASSEEAARVLRAVDPDALVHTACVYGRGGESPSQVLAANVGLGVAFLQAVCEGDRLVSVLSTGSVLDPDVSLYALSKRQFADWGAQLAARAPERLRFIDLKLQHMYGPGDDRSKFTTHVLHALHTNQPELQLTAGEQQRDFIHVDDVVSAYDTVLARAETMSPHEAIEVGSGHAPPVRQFVELVQRLTGATTRLEFGALPYRPNEAMRCIADTTRLRALGWRPRHDLTSGLQDTLSKEFHS